MKTSPKNDDENKATPRRSGRARKSTVIRVKGGHVIKKENNYRLKGDTYVFGIATEETKAKKKEGASKAAKSAAPVVRKPRVLSQAEKDRMENKQLVESRTIAKQQNRQRFILRHLDVLEPFLEPKVLLKFQQQQEKELSNKNNKSSSPRDGDDNNKEIYMQPDLIEADLRDYQLAGLNWMAEMYSNNIGMILGDEMGLGKTLQTISLVCHLREKWNVRGPSLVICPLSVLYSWCNEIEKWAPSLTYLRFHTSNVENIKETPKFHDYDIIVTTYEMAKYLNVWRRHYFNLLILDEGHRIKGHETQIADAVRKIHSENRMILTGTPLANNLVEMWSLLNFLLPDVLTTLQPFADAFDITHNVVDPTKLHQAHELLNTFMLRRLKVEVEKLMPKKIETKICCPLSTTQRWWYKALLIKDINVLAAATSGEKLSAEKRNILNNLLMQLRKCCLHPYLFPGVEDTDPNSTSLSDLIGDSGKLAVLDKLLRSLYTKGHRVVLFSQFTSVLDIIDDYCNMRGWNYCRFDGTTSRARRNYIVNSFNQSGSQKFLFLMSTRSGGVGLNLQTADTCILFDSDWNPQPDIQAMARVHRIGQTKTVHVYRLVTEGTVESRMVERAEKKLFLDRVVTRDGISSDDKEMGGVQNKPSSDDKDENNFGRLLSALKFGCDAVFGDNTQNQSLPTDKEIELITDRNRTENSSIGKLRGGKVSNAKDFDITKQLSSTFNFGGVNFQELRQKKSGRDDKKSIAALWGKKRERKSRIKMVEGKGSGYGSATVPVLVANNYNLQEGEGSVFDRERPQYKQKCEVEKKKKQEWINQDFCQCCGDGGRLICCPKCPVSVHVKCAGFRKEEDVNNMWFCSHHHCAICGKGPSSVGGLLFPCSCCPNSYCEDHLPKEARILVTCERMEELNFDKKQFAYVHCSPQCEQIAIDEFGWSLKKEVKSPCPDYIDVSSYYKGEVDDCVDEDENLSASNNKRRRKQVNYGKMTRKFDFKSTATPCSSNSDTDSTHPVSESSSDAGNSSPEKESDGELLSLQNDDDHDLLKNLVVSQNPQLRKLL